jgi:hypothetical protein
MVCLACINAFGAVINNKDKEFAVFEEAESDWEYFCRDDTESYNNYNLEPIKLQLLQIIEEEKQESRVAMELFLNTDYRKFTDYCIANLGTMARMNQEKYKEILILLAPGLCSAKYIKKIIPVVCNDRNDVMAKNIKHLDFCLDMFFYGAMKNGNKGRVALTQMCKKAFYSPCLNYDENGYHDERFNNYDIGAALEGACFDDWLEIHYDINSIWPNWDEAHQ